jgi:hypothetical protein
MYVVIPGRERKRASYGAQFAHLRIHNPRLWLWIPGLALRAIPE